MQRFPLAIATCLSIALLTGCATSHPIQPKVAPSINFSDAETVSVTLRSFAFEPSTIQLAAGKHYALRLTNSASSSHDFTAPEFFAASLVKPEDAATIADGEVEVAPGQTVVVHLVPAAGRYGLACTHTGHALLGMRGTIVVT